MLNYMMGLNSIEVHSTINNISLQYAELISLGEMLPVEGQLFLNSMMALIRTTLDVYRRKMETRDIGMICDN